MIFAGKALADKIIEKLKPKMWHRSLKLAVIYDPLDVPSRIYTDIKSKKAQELGIDFLQIPIYKSQDPIKSQIASIKSQIEKLNADKTVNGIVIQMPLGFGAWDLDLVRSIDPEKDVDGLREDSPFKPAVVRAVMEILGYSLKDYPFKAERIILVGSKGFVGRRLMQVLPGAVGMDKEDLDLKKLKSADIVISATGQVGLIKPEMVRVGVIAIDVGYPKGDFDPSVADKAALFTPIPGGVGPMTVAMLFANLLSATT